MAQILLHRLDIVPGLNGGHSIRVPEIVEPGGGAANLHHDRLE